MASTMLPMVGLLIVIAVLAALLRFFAALRKTKCPAFPYQKEPTLFSPAERSFLGVLEEAVGEQYRVMGKVRLADVIKVRSGVNGKARQSAFNRIQAKHLDFVVCNAHDLAIQYVVELDDQSHGRAKRQGRDEFIDQALRAAGVPIYHFPVRLSYSVRDIQRMLAEGREERQASIRA